MEQPWPDSSTMKHEGETSKGNMKGPTSQAEANYVTIVTFYVAIASGGSYALFL
jgi:hypothetical protein